MSAEISARNSRSIHNTTHLLTRTSEVLEQLRDVLAALSKVLHDFGKLALDVAFNVLIIWAIFDLLRRLLRP